MTGHAGANGSVGASADNQLAEFRDHALRVSQGVKDRSLAANAIAIERGTRVYVRAAVEKQAGSIEAAKFRGDVEERVRAPTPRSASMHAASRVGSRT